MKSYSGWLWRSTTLTTGFCELFNNIHSERNPTMQYTVLKYYNNSTQSFKITIEYDYPSTVATISLKPHLLPLYLDLAILRISLHSNKISSSILPASRIQSPSVQHLEMITSSQWIPLPSVICLLFYVPTQISSIVACFSNYYSSSSCEDNFLYSLTFKMNYCSC